MSSVAKDYKVQITGYDFINVIAFCKIVPEKDNELPIPKTINANTLHYDGSFNDGINNIQRIDNDGVLSSIKKKANEVGIVLFLRLVLVQAISLLNKGWYNLIGLFLFS